MPSSASVALLQTVIPDYRLGLLQLLYSKHRELSLYAGRDDFGTLKSISPASLPYTELKNHFGFNRKLLWQAGASKELLDAKVLITNNNFRILSTIFIATLRKLSGKRNLAWNHISGRSPSRILALSAMSALYDGMICYTHSQSCFARQIFRGKLVIAAPNACMSKEDCYPGNAPIEEVTNFIIVGRLVPAKKPNLALEAFELAASQLALDARLVFVGDGPERANLEAYTTQSPTLRDRVTFTGHVSSISKLRDQYSKAIAALSPGYVGLSATQAFSFGCPMLIAKNEPHSPEIEACVDGFNAGFFPSDNAKALSELMLSAYRTRTEWLEKRTTISQWTRDRYSFEAMAQSFESAINWSTQEEPISVL